MIKSDLKKVRNLLDESIKYAVPEYQRNFEWKREHAEEFWEDLSENSIFLGTIVLDTSEEEKGVISIVDGQQRLTTIFILLAACRQQAIKIKSDGQALEIQRKISFIDDTSGRASSSKLIPSRMISDIFAVTIANDEWDGKKFELKNKKRQISKIKPIYEFFSEKVSKLDKDELATVLKQLYESTVIRIDVEGTQEAFDIFERTNARGMELNAADLLKKYLFEKSASEKLTEDWDSIVDNSASNILRLIKYYYVSHSGLVQKKELFKKLKSHGEKIGPEQLLKEIKEFSYFYNLITSGSFDSIIEWANDTKNDFFRKEYNAHAFLRTLDAFRLFGVSQGYPLLVKLLIVLGKEEDSDLKNKYSEKLLAFFQSMEKFHFINYAISQRPGNQIEVYYADKCKVNVTSDNFLDFIKEITNEYKKEKVVGQAEFTEKFSSLSYETDRSLIYYIYDRLNNIDRKGGQYVNIFYTNKKLLRKSYDIEHLISQDMTNYSFEEESIADSIDNIGNLIVISKHTNGQLQNKNIVEKLPIIQKFEAQNLVEADILVNEWEDASWDNPEETIANISLRARLLSERAYDVCWKI